MALFVSPHSQGYCSYIFPPASVFFPCPCLASWRPRVPALSAAADGEFLSLLPPACAPTCSPLAPIFSCPMAMPSACICSPPASPWASRPPLSPWPNPLHSLRSTPRYRIHSPLGRPHGAPPCLRLFSPVRHGPVARAPPPPSSSPLQSSPALSLTRLSAFPMHARSILPTLFFFPPPPTGSCGCSPRPSRSFSRPRLPISPVGTKMSAIGQAGLLCVVWWQADPRPVGKTPVGLL